MEQLVLEVWSPIIQIGFALFCLVLLAILVWMIKLNRRDVNSHHSDLINVIRDNNGVIQRNTEVLAAINENVVCNRKLMGDIRDKLLGRPCMFDEDEFKKWLSTTAKGGK